mmetsp:Transcript_27805/g.93485  ORF Transcript_27805/g.93485 Transcript_27805/m.93485 type:complete len:260 (-) Transcript_27805:67-846(-)
MGAIAFGCAATPASRDRPTGPATAPIWPPRATWPPAENESTASCVFSTMRKSATWAPIWKPTERPIVPMADGADHESSANFASTMPVPNLPENANPTFVTRRNARPRAAWSTPRPGPMLCEASMVARILSALVSSSSSRKLMKPGELSDSSRFVRRSSISVSGRCGFARIAVTTSRYAEVGVWSTRTTRSPISTAWYAASPSASTAVTTPSPPLSDTVKPSAAPEKVTSQVSAAPVSLPCTPRNASSAPSLTSCAMRKK